MRPPINIRGKRFGRLVAIEPTNKRHRGYVVWLCRCDCGSLVNCNRDKLVTANRRSCGCIVATAVREAAARYRPAVRAYLQGHESLRVVAKRFGLNYRKLQKRVAKIASRRAVSRHIPGGAVRYQRKATA